MSDLQALAADCEVQVARLRRLRLPEAEAALQILEAFVRELRAGLHGDKPAEIEQFRVSLKVLRQFLDVSATRRPKERFRQ